MEKEFVSFYNQYWLDFLRILPKLLFSIIIILITIYVGKKISSLVRKRLVYRSKDELLSNFISRIVRWIISLVGIIVSLEILGLANFASGLLAGAGVSAIILGFAFKDIGENFLSGLILAMNRPFNIGDVVETKDITGSIISLDLRTTTIKTFEGYDVFVPNSMIVNNPLINFNREGTRRFDFNVGIDYDADINKAKDLILKSVSGIEEILKIPEPFVIISELTSNSTNLRIFFWVNALEAARNLLVIKSEVIELTVKAFKEGGINIPYDSIQIQFGKGFPEIPVNIVSNEKK